MNNGIFRQRIGALIEKHICDKYNLFYNKRQHTLGFYDAYNKDHIYEIKASNNNYNTFIIKVDNHKQLLGADGYYIFVSYILKDTDIGLRVMSDINMLQIYNISAKYINDLIKRYTIPIKQKKHYKIQLSMLQRSNELELLE